MRRFFLHLKDATLYGRLALASDRSGIAMLTEIECIGYVGKALDFARDGLAPFIEAQLKQRRPNTWQNDLSSLFEHPTPPIDPNSPHGTLTTH